MNYQFSKFSCLFCDLTNACCGILADLNINVLEAVKNLRENFCFNDNFGQINGVFRNLGKALANVSFKLGIGVRDQSSQVWNCALINNSLGKLFSVLCNF